MNMTVRVHGLFQPLSLELQRWHIIWSTFKSHHIIFKALLNALSTIDSFSQLLMRCMKVRIIVFMEIQELTFNKFDIIV